MWVCVPDRHCSGNAQISLATLARPNGSLRVVPVPLVFPSCISAVERAGAGGGGSGCPPQCSEEKGN